MFIDFYKKIKFNKRLWYNWYIEFLKGFESKVNDVFVMLFNEVVVYFLMNEVEYGMLLFNMWV